MTDHTDAIILDAQQLALDHNISYYTGDDATEVTRVTLVEPEAANSHLIIAQLIAALDVKGIQSAALYPYVKWDTKKLYTKLSAKVLL